MRVFHRPPNGSLRGQTMRLHEVAAIAEQATEAKARIGSPAEHVLWPSGSADADAVELYEAVQRALE